MSREPVIKVRNMTAGYDETVILNNLSFDIYEGEIFVILGGSGCGKSTLLKTPGGTDSAHVRKYHH